MCFILFHLDKNTLKMLKKGTINTVCLKMFTYMLKCLKTVKICTVTTVRIYGGSYFHYSLCVCADHVVCVCAAFKLDVSIDSQSLILFI